MMDGLKGEQSSGYRQSRHVRRGEISGECHLANAGVVANLARCEPKKKKKKRKQLSHLERGRYDG